MKLFATMLLVFMTLPCFADETAINKAVAKRVYEEGLSRGIFTVPYTDDFVGHGGSTTFTHEDGLKEAKGWRSAFPDLAVNVDLIVAEGDLVVDEARMGDGLALGRRRRRRGCARRLRDDGALRWR